MIETREQAIALHDAIEARTDAFTDFHNCALMPPRQMPEDRLAASAQRWVDADHAVAQLSHGADLSILTETATAMKDPTVRTVLGLEPLPVGEPVETVPPPSDGAGAAA